MTRHPDAIRRRKIRLSLGEDQVARIEALFWDPVRERPKYGAYSFLISKLVDAWFADPSRFPINIEDFQGELPEEENLNWKGERNND